MSALLIITFAVIIVAAWSMAFIWSGKAAADSHPRAQNIMVHRIEPDPIGDMFRRVPAQRDYQQDIIEQRRALIADCRKLIVESEKDRTGDVKSYLEDNITFMRMKKYLSAKYLEDFNSGRVVLSVAKHRVRFGLVSNLVNEIDRLETEWGLDLDQK